MTIFFTSDTHYWHRNIIRYSNRPFNDIEEMNNELIQRWNSVVGDNDTVYHLGDVGFKRDMDDILDQLKGKNKFWIPGNHDKDWKRKGLKGFTRLEQCHEMYVANKVMVVLCHYGMRVWNRCHHGAFHLYGHSHGSLPGNSQSCDVGVDCWDYTPVTFDQIKQRLDTLPPRVSVDHHR